MSFYSPEGGRPTNEPENTTKRFPEEVLRRAAERRGETALIRPYLEQVANSHQRVSVRSLHRYLARVEEKLQGETTNLERLSLIQRRMELEGQIKKLEKPFVDHTEDFIKYGAAFSERKGISYGAWREFGVPPAVLKEAGIK